MKQELSKLTIDKEKYLVFLQDKPYAFPRKEFELLYLLASKPGKVFTRKELLRNVWHKDFKNESRTVDVHIRRLRKKIGKNFISTVIGVGYKFES